MIAGHRGALALAPENTLAGMLKAVESGAKWIEIDTQLSADNVAVIFHDESVERTTNGKGKVSHLTFSELSALDTGSWFSSEYIGEKIPSLEATLLFCLTHNLNINLEIKIHHAHQAQPLVKKVAEVIQQVKFPIERLILSSFSISAVEYCQQFMPNIRRGYITEHDPVPLLAELKSVDLYSIHVDQKILTQAMSELIIQENYKLIIWTMNDLLQAKKFRDWGVDMIITDKPNIFDQK